MRSEQLFMATRLQRYRCLITTSLLFCIVLGAAVRDDRDVSAVLGRSRISVTILRGALGSFSSVTRESRGTGIYSPGQKASGNLPVSAGHATSLVVLGRTISSAAAHAHDLRVFGVSGRSPPSH